MNGLKEISAGGVVYRRLDGRLQVQLIQDRYGKVSLPKGKMEAGETVEQTALREIWEETGITGQIQAPIKVIRYTYNHHDKGTVHKEVHYFLVQAVEGKLKAQVEEIRGVDWFSPQEAWNMQKASGYNNNHEVLAKALEILGVQTEGEA